MGGPIRSGSGPWSEPHDGRDVPFGPEISWPYGFRPLDAESRDLLESAYRAGAVYQQPAMDDRGYGDPGYSDPSYDGPRAQHGSYPGPRPPHGGPAFPGSPGGSRARAAGGPGHRSSAGPVPGHGSSPGPVPGHRPPAAGALSWAGSGYPPQDSAPSASGPEIWPLTGARDALRDAGPQAPAGPRGAGSSGGARSAASAAYPEQWYDNPRLDDRALDPPRYDQPRPGPARAHAARADAARADAAVSPRSPGPRRESLDYDQLRYDDLAPGEPGYDEPLDDESWYQELRRSAPAYPQGPGAEHPSGPQHRVEPRDAVRGPQPDYPQAPDLAPRYRPPHGGSVPSLTAGPTSRNGPAPDPGNFLSAPAAQAGIGVLTPPGGVRPGTGAFTHFDSGALAAPDVFGYPETGAPAAPDVFAYPETGAPAAPDVFTHPDTGTFPVAGPASQVLAPPSVRRPGSVPVRPGHGLDGPEITASWPAQPSADELDSYEAFWREDDEDAEYTSLFEDSGAESARSASAKRRTGRRRGRSNDHRLWLGLGGVVLVTAAAIAGVVKFEFPSHSGPAHTMIAPDRIGTYARTVDLEHQAGVAQLRADVIKMSAGKASQVVSAVYESGNSAAGGTEQIIMFIGGHLANADPGASVASFIQKFTGAKVVSAGSLGGRAACVEAGNNVALCAWFDNDSFGEIVSPTMNVSDLTAAVQTFRPSVERVVVK